MSNRIQLSDEMTETVAGGRITYTWRNLQGTCGINGDYAYAFTDRSAFLSALMDCYAQGKDDSEAIAAMVASGVIHPM